MWTADDVRTKDRAWRVTAFPVVIANLVLGVIETRHYGHAYDACTGELPDVLDCRRSIVDTMDDSNTWMMIASIPLLVSLFLPLRPSTTPWRIACIAVLALSFAVRLILMLTH